MAVIYNFKEGTAASAAERNQILGRSEPGVEIDTGKFKIGNGRTRWNDLPYFIDEDHIAERILAAIEARGASSLAFIRDDGSGYSERDLVTEDPARVVVWIGTDAPPIGAPFAQDNVDVWWKIT